MDLEGATWTERPFEMNIEYGAGVTDECALWRPVTL